MLGSFNSTPLEVSVFCAHHNMEITYPNLASSAFLDNHNHTTYHGLGLLWLNLDISGTQTFT